MNNLLGLSLFVLGLGSLCPRAYGNEFSSASITISLSAEQVGMVLGDIEHNTSMLQHMDLPPGVEISAANLWATDFFAACIYGFKLHAQVLGKTTFLTETFKDFSLSNVDSFISSDDDVEVNVLSGIYARSKQDKIEYQSLLSKCVENMKRIGFVKTQKR